MGKLLKRNEVPIEKTWDLTLIYKSEEEFEKELKELNDSVNILLNYKGKINDADTLYEFMQVSTDLEVKVSKLYAYSHMKYDEDTTNSNSQDKNSRVLKLITEFTSFVSWFKPEFLSLSDKDLEELYSKNNKLELYRTYFNYLRLDKEHVLNSEEEFILAQASQVLNGSKETFSLLNNADLKFDNIKDENGNEVTLSHGTYSKYLESKNAKVRKNAFKTLYKEYINLKNTFSNLLANNVKKDNFFAKVHKYTSARNASLSKDEVPEEVYDTLIKVVNEKLPLLHRYIALQKKVLNSKEFHMYDIYVPMVNEVEIKYTYEEAVKETYNALKPLGEEYAAILKEGFENRWIDVLESEGKRSGAYSSGSYATPPYILLNWRDDLNNFFTLVHEFGHSAHSYLTRKNQPAIYGNYSIFLAEIASTTNENLLTEYLLNKYTDKESQKYILDKYLGRFKSTIFRQTQFAEFEHKIHEDEAKGITLTEKYLSDTYASINAKYYGKDVIQDEEIAYEWARIPHFYMNYYVFQYSTGMAAATALSQKILKGNNNDLNNYLDFLKAGTSLAPIEVMKKAGVDMTQEQYLYDAFKVFEERLEKLEKLFEE